MVKPSGENAPEASGPIGDIQAQAVVQVHSVVVNLGQGRRIDDVAPSVVAVRATPQLGLTAIPSQPTLGSNLGRVRDPSSLSIAEWMLPWREDKLQGKLLQKTKSGVAAGHVRPPLQAKSLSRPAATQER